ncbi:MAG: ABC transporter permease [Dehalococcoidia bacterium]
MRAIFWKELADHFGRRRFLLLLGLVVLGIAWGIFITAREVYGATGVTTQNWLFLDMFLTNSGIVPSLLFYLSFFGPLIGIALGFDSINSERTQGTLPRVLSQPVFRDAVFNGKFLAGMTTMAVMVIAIMVGVIGSGMFILKMAPAGAEVVRLLGFGIIAIVYLAFWLVLAMTASTFLRNTVSSALASLGIWLFSGVIVGLVANVVADLIVPSAQTASQALRHYTIYSWIARISPGEIFSEATSILLDPVGGRSVTPLAFQGAQLERLLATPVSAGQSLQLVWPHIVVLLGMGAVLVALSYIKFMREEIRA